MLQKKCTYCGNLYERRHNWNYDEFERSKFCSKKCHHSMGRIKSFCVVCWSEFETTKFFENRIVCCSPDCTNKRRSENMKKRWISKKEWEWTQEKNPRWKSVGTKVDDGHWYILVKISEWEWFDNWKLEHVHVMEQYIWRKINSKFEAIHHIDWDKMNNSLVNLFLTTQSYHRKLHQSIFMDLVKELLEKDIIYFDRTENIYKVR